MKGMSRILLGATIVAVLPLVAGAAGTYYNGNLYQNPQGRYGASAAPTNNAGGFYNNYGAGRGYGQNMQNMQAIGVRKTTVQTTKKSSSTKTNSTSKQGLSLGVDLAHEFASWDFEMATAGSKLHYDSLRWNVIGGELAYYFGGSTPMQVKVGGKYGMQFDEAPMVDDDISSEYMWEWDGDNLVGVPALSVGTSKDGVQYGFNASFGLTDLFNAGGVKITPSVGYRYFKYQLETKNNYGLMVQVIHNSDTLVNCVDVGNGEIQCSPFVAFVDSNKDIVGFGSLYQTSPGVFLTDNTGSFVVGNASYPYLNLGSTYYYEQPGTSHKYETEWAGPYIALDMEYEINNDNVVTAGVEFGLPIYDSKGDQPYRVDWAHPTSVEDKGDFGDAYHLGLNAMWSTSISDSMMLSLGMTYDYYHVKDATATTYLNAAYHQIELDYYQALYDDNVDNLTEEGINYLNSLKALKAAGWKMESPNEIESVYKSMGIRLGLNVKF